MPTQPLIDEVPPSSSPLETQLLELFFDRVPMGVAVFDTDMRLQRCNKTWTAFYEHYLGVPEEYTAPGRRLDDLIPHGIRETLLEPIEGVPETTTDLVVERKRTEVAAEGVRAALGERLECLRQRQAGADRGCQVVDRLRPHLGECALAPARATAQDRDR